MNIQKTDRQLALRFTEKITYAPIVDLLVRVECNGIAIMSVHTDSNGALPTIRPLRDNDRVEIFVRKLGGGYKHLTAFVVGADADFTLYSPKTKAILSTDEHFVIGSQPTDGAEQINIERSDGPLTIENGRSASNHPKVILSTESAVINMPQQRTISGLLFPLEKRPIESYHSGARRFGARRDHGRLHAGIDLYAPIGTPVRAMADGIVRWAGNFYCGTHDVVIDHGSFIARYGEVKPSSVMVKAGQVLSRGEKIAEIGKMLGIPNSMLHLEMYATTLSPTGKVTALTQRTNPPFARRDDLINPAPSIDFAVME